MEPNLKVFLINADSVNINEILGVNEERSDFLTKIIGEALVENPFESGVNKTLDEVFHVLDVLLINILEKLSPKCNNANELVLLSISIAEHLSLIKDQIEGITLLQTLPSFTPPTSNKDIFDANSQN